MKRKTLELSQVQALCEIINGLQTLMLSIADITSIENLYQWI